MAQSQAAPETTVNEAVRYLEQGARSFTFLDRDLATPPGSPANGDCYLVAASATGAWAGQDGKIAFRMSTAWEFIPPQIGFRAYVHDEGANIVYTGLSLDMRGLKAVKGDERPIGKDRGHGHCADA